jgi:hypothetical protein
VVPHIFFGIHQIQSCSRSGQWSGAHRTRLFPGSDE